MSLEKDIQQEKFENEKQKVFINLLYTYQHLVTKISALFKSFGITRQQYNVLRILRGQHPKSASVKNIKTRMIDKMSDASRIVERLRIKNLIKRKPCSSDRRVVEVYITEKGLKLLNQVDPLVAEFEQNEISLSINEAKSLNHSLDKLRENK
ncbi:MAG: MarR family transcriptional regulator [Cyclobacteriaceae bacterium]|nr:MarR family transcriptional regulator [Cyclobacteriaceae bacterium]